MRIRFRELALGIVFVFLGLVLFWDGYDLLSTWQEASRCTPGLACVVQVIYSPILPWLLFVFHLTLFLLAAFGGWWVYSEWKRRATPRRSVWRLTAGVLLFALSAWSAGQWLLTGLGGYPPIRWGSSADPAVLAHYGLLISMPLVAAGVGSGMAVQAVRRRPAAPA